MAWQVWALASGLLEFSFGRLRRWRVDGLKMMLTSQRYPIYVDKTVMVGILYWYYTTYPSNILGSYQLSKQ
jgi:hypothetical protein